MLIRPKSASRTRTKHTPTETFQQNSQDNSEVNAEVKIIDGTSTELTEVNNSKAMASPVPEILVKFEIKEYELGSKRVNKTGDEVQKRSISSQDYMTSMS